MAGSTQAMLLRVPCGLQCVTGTPTLRAIACNAPIW